ncbi:uncharacterized protein [Aquarana catesbeiana]|uniref:uncharacterized protein n=1 Tax=Aquarana catesbeiana TaxID=8400 RepID=UPI003CCA1BB5
MRDSKVEVKEEIQEEDDDDGVMEESEFPKVLKDLYQDTMVESSSYRNSPERCPRPLYSWDSTQEGHLIPHHHQSGNLEDYNIVVKEEYKEEDEEYGAMKEYLEGHNDLYKDVMIEHQQPLSFVNIERTEFPRNEKILNLNLEVLSLLTREDCEVVMKKSKHNTRGRPHQTSTRQRRGQNLITTPPPPSLIPERQNEQKILKLTTMMIHLLTGEVPIRCQDVTVYFSMEEWEYLEGHKDLYKDVMMDNQLPLTSPDGSSNRNPPERCPRPLYSRDSTQEDHTIPHHHQFGNFGDNNIHIKEEYKEEDHEDGVMEEIQKNLYQDTMVEQSSYRNPPARCPRPLYSWDSTQEGHIIPHHHQSGNLENYNTLVKEEYKEEDEEYGVMDYLQGHRDLHKDVLLDNQPPLTSPDECDVGSSSEWSQVSSDYDGEEYGSKTKSRGVKTYLCPECGQGFKEKSNLQRHMRVHTGVSFPCKECGKCFSRSDRLTEHLRNHTGEQLHTCTKCGKSFSGKYRLIRHLKIHTDDNLHPCPDCGQSSNQKDGLCSHQKIHMVMSSHSCSECGISFDTLSELTIHQRAHAGKEIFPCSECGKVCGSKSHLIIHQRNHTGVKPYSCSQCQKGFVVMSELVIHQRSHTGELPFSCPECGKGFTRHGNLTNHMKVHIQEKPFSCPECDRSFKRKSEFAMHLNDHTGDHPFSCSVCGKGFSHKGKLHVHERTHTGFKRQVNLTNDKKVHTGKKRFFCPECEKSFTRKNELVMHLSVHTGDYRFHCSVCGKGFSHRGKLNVHERTHKRERP